MVMKRSFLLFSLSFLFSMVSLSQEMSVSAFNAKYLNWYNLDLVSDSVTGTSVDKAYSEILAGMEPKKVVTVAVIDGGVDINHTDLEGKIWVNEDEIAGDGIDNDNNGYIDDIHGWNFLGNAKGENVNYENYEYTRLYKEGPDNPLFENAKVLYEEELAKRLKEREQIVKFDNRLKNSKKIIKENTGVEVNGLSDLDSIVSDDDQVKNAVGFLKQRYSSGFTDKGFEEYKKRNTEFLRYFLNRKFNPRDLIGDNPQDINDNHYGNADVIGPRADHGTCVTGIIAANRGNGIGVDGIASSVKIMVLRVVPNGDERDKDIALAIRYAVDNGADIINMSFGKAISPERVFVNDAIKYAEAKNVLIVHASGNEAADVDEVMHYPTDVYLDNTDATNMIIVGATSMEKGDSLVCYFSNYGKEHVDIFAPGHNIVALDTCNTYSIGSGTSQASPVVTGIAAVLLSYYPDLSPQDIISILMNSSAQFPEEMVFIPDLKGKDKGKATLRNLSRCGGIANMYNALKVAEKYKR